MSNWTDQALCAQVGGDTWFPTDGASSPSAIKLCNQCPARELCLKEALEIEPVYDFGIRGGLYANERRALRKTLRHQQAALAGKGGERE